MTDIVTKGSTSAWVPQPPEPVAPSWVAYNRTDGLRVKLTKVHGVTQGDALKVLANPYYFQCPPLDSFVVPKSHTHSPFANYKGDQFLQRGGKDLEQIQLRTLAVEYGRYATVQDWDVQRLVKDLQRLCDAGWPFDLLAWHPYNDEPELHIRAVLLNVSATENHGEEDARYLDMTFSEWRNQAVDRRGLTKRPGKSKYPTPFTLQINKDGTAKVRDRHSKSGYRSFDLHKGDELTLATIAKYVYGTARYGRDIAIAQKPPIRDWGMHTPLVRHPRFKHGGNLFVPEIDIAIKGQTQGSVPA